MAYNYMTQAGYDKLIAEINELESVHRPEISRQIAEARDKGDLSENAEYDAAKEAQGLLEGKIAQLKAQVANARIIDESKISTDSIQILSKVTIRNTKTGAELTYTLVSDTEANLKEKKISVNTPIAKGLMGRKVGDVVEVQTPGGLLNFEILKTSIYSRFCSMATLFTRIIEGEIPSYRVAEDAEFYAFLDINPVQPGHTLVVPRQEVDYVFDIEDDLLGRMMVFAKQVARQIQTVTKCRKVAVLVLGLEVNHAHIHLVPINAEGDIDLKKKLQLPAEEMERIARELREAAPAK